MNFGPKLPPKQFPVSPSLTTFEKMPTALKLMTANAKYNAGMRTT